MIHTPAYHLDGSLFKTLIPVEFQDFAILSTPAGSQRITTGMEYQLTSWSRKKQFRSPTV
jgi:hypothetical protein